MCRWLLTFLLRQYLHHIKTPFAEYFTLMMALLFPAARSHDLHVTIHYQGDFFIPTYRMVFCAFGLWTGNPKECVRYVTVSGCSCVLQQPQFSLCWQTEVGLIGKPKWVSDVALSLPHSKFILTTGYDPSYMGLNVPDWSVIRSAWPDVYMYSFYAVTMWSSFMKWLTLSPTASYVTSSRLH